MCGHVLDDASDGGVALRVFPQLVAAPDVQRTKGAVAHAEVAEERARVAPHAGREAADQRPMLAVASDDARQVELGDERVGSPEGRVLEDRREVP